MLIGFMKLPNLSRYCGYVGIEVAQIVSKYVAVQSKTYVIQNRRILINQLLKSGLDSHTANRTVTILISSPILQLTNKNQCAINLRN
ncbi:hypothetical protein NIES4072_07200 [Nostoc commune NIES-4072]|uniref:Uncharacterized protein n=1 Tax=Nostoc commune NIES-4072 TaxID=2005467 RepID=A0A2R5FMQ6_NOSCO|nr:hypothetical protein NIES4070_19630 [Nostoc commune HK-02]GBG17071.1 hypothetical protein NIES4072_07200 [Nostoc commune NIES-4072]